MAKRSTRRTTLRARPGGAAGSAQRPAVGGRPAAPAGAPRRPAPPGGVEEPFYSSEEAREQHRELVEAQQALEDSRDRYASLFDYAPVALLSLRRNGIIEDINIHGADLLGAARPRIVGMPLLAFVAPGDQRPFLNHMLRCRREHDAVNTELNLRTRQGRTIPVLLSAWKTAAHFRPEYEFRTAITDLSERQLAASREADYQARLRSLASELSLAEERERRRIAVEIHDHISQSLAMAKMKLDAASHRSKVPDVRQELAEVVRLVETVLGHTRSLTFELSPPVLYELGLEAALEWLGERAAQRSKIDVKVDVPQRMAVPHETAVLLYQAVRELLVNVGKHAAARRARVEMRQAGANIRVCVEDDGTGFGDLRPAEGNGQAAGHFASGGTADTGFGLFSIRARLEHLGGKLEIGARPGGGGRVIMTVPLPAAREGPNGPVHGTGITSLPDGDLSPPLR